MTFTTIAEHLAFTLSLPVFTIQVSRRHNLPHVIGTNRLRHLRGETMYDVDVYLNVQKIPDKKKKRNLFVFYKVIRVFFPGFDL